MMGRSTPNGPSKARTRFRKSSFLYFFLFFLLFQGISSGVLLDQTVAVVGKRVLTLRDVEAHFTLQSILESQRIPVKDAVRKDLKLFERARQELIHNMVVLNYLESTELTQNPHVSAVELKNKWKAQLLRSFSTPKEMNDFLSTFSIHEIDVDQRLLDRARVELFIENDFGSKIHISERDVQAYYEEQKESRFLGKPFESVSSVAKAQTQRDKIKKEFQKWIEIESRRTEINLIPFEPNGK